MEKVINVDESEVPGDPRMFRINKGDIERVGYSDGCVSCNAKRASKPAQRHSEYCRRRVQENQKGSEEGRQRLEKAEECFTEALVWTCERIDSLGMQEHRCTEMRSEQRHRQQPRQEIAKCQEPPVKLA